MHKWEYKTLFLTRYAKPESVSRTAATPWNYVEDGANLGSIDVLAKLRDLGEAGWELTGISSRSGNPSNPGFSTEEIWVFKRPR